MNKNKPHIVLICKNVKYFSRNDEECFFVWLEAIKCIEKIETIQSNIYLYIKNIRISDDNLRDLIALFQRYKIKDMHQLAIFLNNKNKRWFQCSLKFWYKKIFGSKKI